VASNVKGKLQALLQHGTLKAADQEKFEDFWDALHRYGKLSPRQEAVVDTAYYEQKLDRVEAKPPAPRLGKSKVGFVPAKVNQVIRVRSMTEFARHCPDIIKGSPVWERVEAFLNAGNFVELRPEKKSI